MQVLNNKNISHLSAKYCFILKKYYICMNQQTN